MFNERPPPRFFSVRAKPRSQSSFFFPSRKVLPAFYDGKDGVVDCRGLYILRKECILSNILLPNAQVELIESFGALQRISFFSKTQKIIVEFANIIYIYI